MHRCFHTDDSRCERNAVHPYKYCELHMSEAKCLFCDNNQCGRHCIYSRYPFDKKSKLCGTLVSEGSVSRVCYVHSKLWCQLCGNTLICYDYVCSNTHCKYAKCHNLATTNGLCKIHEHALCISCDRYNMYSNTDANCIYCDQYICKECNFPSLCVNKICAFCVADICIANGNGSFPMTKYIDIFIDYVSILSDITKLSDRTCGIIISYTIKKLSKDDLSSTQTMIAHTISELEDSIDIIERKITILNNIHNKSRKFMNYI